jgi:hypothetical protein
MVNTTRIFDSTAQPRIVFPLLGLLGLLVCTIAVPLSAHAAFNTTYIRYEVTSTVDTLEGADATTLAALAAENITVGQTLTLTSMIPEDQVGEVAACGSGGENLVYAADDPSRGTEISVGNLVLSNMRMPTPWVSRMTSTSVSAPSVWCPAMSLALRETPQTRASLAFPSTARRSPAPAPATARAPR